MLNEITAAALFLVQLMEKSGKFSPDQVDSFGRHLVESLTRRFENHWFPDKPFKGQGYRCIRVNGHSRRDSTLESAAIAAGVKYEDLSLPVELTLWVDPHEVCCRFGESKGSYCTLASFEREDASSDLENDKENSRPRAQGSGKSQKILPILAAKTNAKGDKESRESSKPAALGTSGQNQQQQRGNNVTVSSGRRRNLNSPRPPHQSRNRSWFNHSFGMGFSSHPAMSQPAWYNMMHHPHFLSGPSPPPFIGHRASKWIHPSSYPTSGFTRFHQWSTNTPKAILKV